MNFNFNQLSNQLVRAISDLGYESPTEIQEKAIPVLLANETDFVGQAQTGTGKTAAFCLPLLEKLDPAQKGIQALILSPTRELANQINDELIKFSKYTNYKTATVFGGVDYSKQIKALRDASIVIATPGRAIDLLKRGNLKIGDAKFFVIDEADEMLKMGFIEDVEMLMDRLSDSVKTWMFSATMPPQIVRLMEEKLDNPEMIRVKKKTLSNDSVLQSACRIQRKDFLKALKAILLTEEDFYGIIFCETREETKTLSEKLQDIGKKVVALHGDLNQRQRDHAMAAFKNKRAEVLVSTDVGARGLDVSEVTHVINMGLPRRSDSYVHRIGRTGRAGKSGLAISFVAPHESRNLKFIERLTNQKMIDYQIPDPSKSKKNKVVLELEKMINLKKAIIERGDDFKVDDSYYHYREFLKDMSKEDVLKLLFTYQFNSDFRSIDETLENLKNSVMVSREDKKRGGRGRRDGRRGNERRDRGSRSGDGDGEGARRSRRDRSRSRRRR